MLAGPVQRGNQSSRPTLGKRERKLRHQSSWINWDEKRAGRSSLRNGGCWQVGPGGAMRLTHGTRWQRGWGWRVRSADKRERERERWWWVGLVWSLKYILNWNQVSAVNLIPSKRYLPKLKQIGEKYCAAGFEVKNNFGYCNFPDLN
jgi:hypothetical protein